MFLVGVMSPKQAVPPQACGVQCAGVLCSIRGLWCAGMAPGGIFLLWPVPLLSTAASETWSTAADS